VRASCRAPSSPQALDALELLEPGVLKDVEQIRRQLQRQEEEAAAAARPREPAAVSPIATRRLRPVSPVNGDARAEATNGSSKPAAGPHRIPVTEGDDSTDDSDAEVETLVLASDLPGAQDDEQLVAAVAPSEPQRAEVGVAATAAPDPEAAEALARAAAAEAARLEAAMHTADEAAAAAEAAHSETARRAAAAFSGALLGDAEVLQRASFTEAVALLKERGTAAFKRGAVRVGEAVSAGLQAASSLRAGSRMQH
jgi:hypothetical protein